MVVTQSSPVKPNVTWEKLPDDFRLEEEPVENTGQPLIAGALRESLELIDFINPEMLVASNFGICATIDGALAIKAPDWIYVPNVLPLASVGDRRSYTPKLEGDIPAVVMEFLSESDGGEYSSKRTYPPGKWFFYEQILRVPIYVIFNPADGAIELHELKAERYELASPNANGYYWIASMGLFLGSWHGTKEQRTGHWLRWWDAERNLLPWAVERIEQERQRTEQEYQRAERLAEYLRSQGINPDDI